LPTLVSTIIPAYNSQSTIERAIESVLSQKVPQTELIVVDDGSKDLTALKVRKYGKRVRYVHQKNQGVSVARNLGMRLARGRLIAFLDADDQWLPGKLRHQIEVFERYPSAMAASTGVRFLNEEGRLIRVYSRERRGNVFADLLNGNFIIMSSLILKKECLREMARPWFPVNVFYGEDYAFCLELAFRCDFYASSKALVNYTQPSDDSFLRKFSKKGFEKSYDAIIRAVRGYCGEGDILRLRSRLHLEVAAIHARKGLAREMMGETLEAFRMNPFDLNNVFWYLQNFKALLRNLGRKK
jgi:glycosyltransferase involved in cell wall biosynthesis